MYIMNDFKQKTYIFGVLETCHRKTIIQIIPVIIMEQKG